MNKSEKAENSFFRTLWRNMWPAGWRNPPSEKSTEPTSLHSCDKPPLFEEGSGATHPDGRKANQDRVLLPGEGILQKANAAVVWHGEERAVAAIADGVSNCCDGGFAAEVALRALQEEMPHLVPDPDAPAFPEEAVLREWILAVNRAVLSACAEKYGEELCATTLSVVMLTEDSLFTVNVGDSPILLLRDGELAMVSNLHTVAAQKKARGRPCSEREAHILTQYIGDPLLEESDLYYTKIPHSAGDSILLCSDGVTEALDAETIRQLLQRRASAEEVIQKARKKDPGDNISAVVFYL